MARALPCWFLIAAFLPIAAGADANHPMPQLTPDARVSAMVAGVDSTRLSQSVDTLVNFGTRNDFSENASTATHGVFGARDWIAAQFRAIAAGTGGRMTVALDTYLQPKTKRTPRAVTESSVIATLQGDAPGRIYVMASHFDDCDGSCVDGDGAAPGADDNASAVAAVLEAARATAQTHFRGTIVFACFDGEELGLWGSAHFASELAARHAPVLAVLNNDIVGETSGGNGEAEPHVVRVFSEGLPAGADRADVNATGSENDSPSRELARFVGETVPVYVPDFRVRQIYRADRFLRGGDQESFQDQGYAAIRFVEAHENYEHQHQNVRMENGQQYGDLDQFIDAAYLARVTQANVAALATLALGPAPPAQVRMVAKHLGYATELRWETDPSAASYEVVWRASDASQWQYAADAGDVTNFSVPASKDDYVFGVRAVDSAGLRSPAVYPAPTTQ